jgi:transposase InsO family protein
MQVGVRVLHGRPYHPQTQGKDERFHRTLNTEVLDRRHVDLPQCQKRFDTWRHDYNWIRPHQALNLDVPGKHFKPSQRGFPERLPDAEYAGTGVDVRRVDVNGYISLCGERWKIGKAFIGQRVGVEATATDGLMNVLFHGCIVKKLDRRSGQ